jgi:TPR repeat protein
MKRAMAAAILALAMSATAQAAPRDDVGSIDPGGDHDPSEYQVQLPPDPEGKAEELRLAGKCDEAVPILRRLSDNDDIAQYNLGLCLIALGKKEQDAARSAGLEREGAQWILRAANQGLPNAQASLVSVYLDGSGVAADPVEAAKWSLLYQENGTRLALGLPDIPDAVETRLDGTVDATSWAAARKRAAAWTPASRRNAEN